MNVLVVGNGAREHAIAWKLKVGSQVDNILVAPGNGGTSQIATNIPILPTAIDDLAKAAVEHSIDVTIVGPEIPLATGIVDLFASRGLAIFGPSRQASRLEWSKAFAKKLMHRAGVPTAEFKVFCDYVQAITWVEKHEGPLVVKADGLAAGKGVMVCTTTAEALQALRQCMKERMFGVSGQTVVVEECLSGPEISVFAFCDGEHISNLIAACDYKRALDGDMGPNTGGMGAYSPPANWTPELGAHVRDRILFPVVNAMSEAGSPFVGVLYAGLMITDQGPQVLEFNCRLGDPEAQVLLPLMETDLAEVVHWCLEGEIHKKEISWSRASSVGVVAAAQGYPGDYAKGLPIHIDYEVDQEVLVFHGGTKVQRNGQNSFFVTDGGRVLTVSGCGPTLAQAREKVYDNIPKISFEGAHYRRDIGVQPPYA